jgi:hypothetical protein
VVSHVACASIEQVFKRLIHARLIEVQIEDLAEWTQELGLRVVVQPSIEENDATPVFQRRRRRIRRRDLNT